MPPKRRNPTRSTTVEKKTTVSKQVKTTSPAPRGRGKSVPAAKKQAPPARQSTRQATKPVAKPTAKPITKPAAKPATKPTTKPAAKLATKPAAKGKGKAATKAAEKNQAKKQALKDESDKESETESESEEEIVKVVTKGGAAVDQYFPNKDKFRVYSDGKTIYTTTMNQSNLDHNNNKFYIAQIVQNEQNSQIFIFNRWGRVGVPGQQAVKGPYSSDLAIREYNSKVNAKLYGGYTKLDIKYDEEEKTSKKVGKGKGSKKDIKKNVSSLKKPVQDLMNLIFDRKMIDTAMKEIGYDAKKCPLGKLGDQSIKEAYTILNKLSEAIKKKKGISTYNQLSGEFFSHIPHDFGFQKMQAFVIDTDDKVEKKLNMLQSLTDMKIATKILDAGDKDEDEEAIVDKNYKSLKNKIQFLDPSTKEHKQIVDYINDSCNNNWSKVKVKDIFTLKRDGEDKRFDKKVGNDQYLWHGSRLQNYVGILSQGLRIAPPEAPVNGYAYGKGVYFANAFATSIGYCWNQNTNEKCMLLCKVALGKVGPLKNRLAQRPIAPEHDSCIGFACKNLTNKAYSTMNGVKMPSNSAKEGQNAYIIYDVAQAQLEYLIRFE